MIKIKRFWKTSDDSVNNFLVEIQQKGWDIISVTQTTSEEMDCIFVVYREVESE